MNSFDVCVIKGFTVSTDNEIDRKIDVTAIQFHIGSE